MIAVMVAIHMFVRVFFYYQRKIGKTNISCEFPFHRREYIALWTDRIKKRSERLEVLNVSAICNKSMIKAIIEMIAIAPEIEPYLTSLEEIENFSKRLSSEELYNKISAQLKKDNLNPF